MKKLRILILTKEVFWRAYWKFILSYDSYNLSIISICLDNLFKKKSLYLIPLSLMIEFREEAIMFLLFSSFLW